MKNKIISYKGFESDMTCRGFQYEIGKEYSKDGEIKVCESGFHACPMPLDVLNYYPLIGEKGVNKFALVEQSGEIKKEGDKIASDKIKIKETLSFSDLFRIESEILKDSTKKSDNICSTTGDCAHSSTSGYRAHSSTSGYRAHSSTTGDCAIAASFGINSKAKAQKGWIVIVDWMQDKNSSWYIKKIHSAKVGGKIKNTVIKPDVYYWFEQGELRHE